MTLLPPRILRSFCLAILFVPTHGFSQDAPTAANVSFYGYQINQPRWRSTDFPKTITLPGGGTIEDADGIYGSLGWLLPAFDREGDLPPFAAGADPRAQETLTYASPTYAEELDDPTESPGEDVGRILPEFKAIAYQNPGAGEEALLYQFELQEDVPSSFLIGIAFGNLAHPDEDLYGTASYRAAINGGPTTAQIPAIVNDSLIDWVFFRVDGAEAGDVVDLFGTGGPNGMASVALIAFDPVP